jgi:hypothetical protein
VFRSSVATPLPEGTVLFSMAMRMVQADDYHGLAEFARCGRHKVLTDGRRCGFKIALNPEFSGSCGLPPSLTVNRAGLLHYAVSIGSFRAAAALLVISPDLAKTSCCVQTDTDENQAWSTLELARLFCELYANDGSDPDLSKTLQEFKTASRVLEACVADDCTSLPFLGLVTPQERIAAAGCDAQVVLAALSEAAAARP